MHGRSCEAAAFRGTGPEQREGAQGDARDDGGPADGLDRAGRVAEDDDACHRADEWLDVDEGPGHLGGHPALPVGEERERQQRATGRESHGGQDRRRAVRGGGHALGRRRERQHGEGGSQELHGRDRDRVAVPQQPGLRHGERRRHQQRPQHQGIAGC
jgi:hypothetical protein